MRTQTIAGRFDGQELLAGPVDTTGWLAEPQTGSDPVGGTSAAVPAGQQDATLTEEVPGRRAGGRETGRSARRSRRVRHLRRVRTENLRSDVVGLEAPSRVDAGPRSSRRLQGLRGSDPVIVSQDEQATVAAQFTGVEITTEGYRLGRWARLALTVTALAAIAVVVVTLTAGSAPQAMVDVTVAPGDTLWSIAGEVAPDRDPRDVIEEIRQLNDMQGGVLPIGVVLRVPSTVE